MENNQIQTTSDQSVSLPVDIAWPDLQAAISGNLAKLTAEGQVKYYNALCKFTGLNPLGFPFEWITFQGKLKLYPKKECADQLRGVHKISVKITERIVEFGMYVVRVVATMPDGREFPATGAVPFAEGMPALDKCKALKVAETQASRRATFGLVGLGNIPDEDDQPQARAVAIVADASEESAEARIEKLNAALKEPEKVIEVEPVTESHSVAPRTPAQTQTIRVAAQSPFDQPEILPPSQPTPPNPPAGVPTVAAAVQLLTEEEVGELMAAMSGLAQPKRGVEYCIYRGWLEKGKGLEHMQRSAFINITKKTPAFIRMVDGWKGIA